MIDRFLKWLFGQPDVTTTSTIGAPMSTTRAPLHNVVWVSAKHTGRPNDQRAQVLSWAPETPNIMPGRMMFRVRMLGDDKELTVPREAIVAAELVDGNNSFRLGLSGRPRVRLVIDRAVTGTKQDEFAVILSLDPLRVRMIGPMFSRELEIKKEDIRSIELREDGENVPRLFSREGWSRLKPSVVVHVEGGCVDSVQSNVEDVEVTVIDYEAYPRADHEKICRETNAQHEVKVLGPEDWNAAGRPVPEAPVGRRYHEAAAAFADGWKVASIPVDNCPRSWRWSHDVLTAGVVDTGEFRSHGPTQLPPALTAVSYQITGSYGTLKVDENGVVLHYEPSEEADEEDNYRDIAKVDIAEYTAQYGEMPESVDILRVGYWDKKDNYEPPESDARADQGPGPDHRRVLDEACATIRAHADHVVSERAEKIDRVTRIILHDRIPNAMTHVAVVTRSVREGKHGVENWADAQLDDYLRRHS